jgi:regulator of sigma E protease
MDGFFDLAQLVATNIWIYGVTFLFILSLLVFVHEWGHYIVARMCGVRVEVFSIGFGKEIFGFNDKHGTRWKFSWIPLGGYVKMFGDTDPASAGHVDAQQLSEEDHKVAFFKKSVAKRSAIVFAGPAINFLFAILLLAGLYMAVGKPIVPPHATGIEVNGAADQAGFEPHDVIKAVNGQPIDSFDDIRRDVMLALNTPLQFTIQRGDQQIDLTATPKVLAEEDRFGFKHERGYLGLIGPANGIDVNQITMVNGVDTKDNPDKARQEIFKNFNKYIVIHLKKEPVDSQLKVKIPSDLNKHLNDKNDPAYNALILGVRPGDTVVKFNPVTATFEAVRETGSIIVDTLGAIWQMITGVRSATELGGIVRIGAIAGDMAEKGLIALITFTALLSINLGLINLFPIPMLDGGHLTFYAIEAAKGSPLSEKAQEIAFRFGFVLLVALMVFANLNDLIQLIL